MKILLIRFSSIGDIVLTTPVIRCLKNQLENAELHFLTKDAFKDIAEANPYLSKVYSMQTSVTEIIGALLFEKYDLIIDLHDNIRSRQVAALLKVKTYRYNKQRFKRFLLVQFKVNLLNNHIVDRYFSAVKKLNVINDGKGLDYFIPEKEEMTPDKLPFTHIAGFCVLVIGAKHFTKQIPKEKLEELCTKVAMPILLIGGLLIGFGTRYAGGKFVITPDTGMMHIAAAFNKRIISIFGGTEKRLGFTPYNNNANSVMIENTNLSCRPCHKHGLDKCPKGHFKCMLDLDMQKVMDVL